MPQAAFALAGMAGSFLGAGAAPLAGTGLLAGLTGSTAISGFMGLAFKQLAVSLVLGAVSRAVIGTPEGMGGHIGQRVRMSFSENNPGSFVMGRRGTPGELLYQGAWDNGGSDTPNEYYVQVIELSDLPATMNRVWINGEYVKLSPIMDSSHSNNPIGYPVEGYYKDGEPRLWVKFYDGTQTVADPYLLEKFGDHPDRPWTSDMVGYGMAYAIVTSGIRGSINRQRPECIFDLSAWGHYDPRKDSTAGGSGTQRWNDWTTWKPSTNPIVLIYNIIRGIHDPITGDFIWGGQDISARHLPISSWFAAMNACDVPHEDSDDKVRPTYTAGVEVMVDVDPARYVEELLKACVGDIAEVAGEWFVRAGGPGIPVYSYTSDHLLTDFMDDFDPFPSPLQSYNGIMATFVDPESGWVTIDAPARLSETYVQQDGGFRNVASVSYDAVINKFQAQQLMLTSLRNERRFRVHNHVIGPEARALTVLDEVEYTSVRDGYENKVCSINLLEDMENGCCAIALREVNPNDYDYNKVDDLPVVTGYYPRPPRPRRPADFAVYPDFVKDSQGRPRAPAIRLEWTVRAGVTGILIRVRLKNDPDKPVQTNLRATRPEEEPVQEFVLKANNQAVLMNGQPVKYFRFTNVAQGYVLISGKGIVGDEDYEVNAMYEPIPGHKWLDTWLSVHTPDVRLGLHDFDDVVVQKVTDAETNANDAAERVQELNTRVDRLDEFLDNTSTETLNKIQDIVDQLEGINTGTIQEIYGIGLAGLAKGWVRDPTFHYWENGVPTYWNVSAGFTNFGSRVTDGFYPSSLFIDTGGVTNLPIVIAANSVHMKSQDFTDDMVVASMSGRIFTGDISKASLRVEWRRASNGVWTPGDAFGEVATNGGLGDRWGFVVGGANNFASREFIFKKPAFTADALRLVLTLKDTTNLALSMRVDYLDVRAATEAEKKAYSANAYADAAVNTLSTTILGPAGALAAQKTAITAEYGLADAAINEVAVAAATKAEAVAGRITEVETRYGGNNLVKNPAFSDGVRAFGDPPYAWAGWDPGMAVAIKNPAGNVAVRDAPTRYFGAFTSTDAEMYEARAHPPEMCSVGDRIRVGFMAASNGTGVETRLQIRVRFFDANDEHFFTDVRTHVMSNALDTVKWTQTDFATIPVPAGAVKFDTYLRRPAVQTNHPVYFTNVDVRMVDRASFGLATSAMASASSASQTVATWKDRVDVTFGDFNTFVDATATAYASAEKALSSYVVRVKDGAFGIYHWDDTTGTGTAIRLSADDVLIPGTLSTGTLVITDLGYNMVPDDQLQSKNSWSGGQFGFSVLPTTTNEDADSNGELRYQDNGSALPVQSFSRPFPVRQGQRLLARYEAQSISGGAMVVRARIAWYGKNDVYTGITTTIGNINTASTALQSVELNMTVPSTLPRARRARFIFEVLAGNSGNCRFFSPKVISNEDASVLITPDGAFFNELQARTAWIQSAMIADAQVGTLKIGENAVTVPLFVERTSPLLSSGSYQDIVSFNVPMSTAGTIVVNSVVYVEVVSGATPTASEGRSVDLRIVIGGAVVFEILNDGMAGGHAICGGRTVAAGTHTVSVQFRHVPPYVSGSRARQQRTSVVAIGAKR